MFPNAYVKVLIAERNSTFDFLLKVYFLFGFYNIY